MELEPTKECQWYNCLVTASQHVIFGLRIHDADGSAHFSEQVNAPEHYDLCPKHVVEVRINYYFADQLEIGKCHDSRHRVDSGLVALPREK